MQCNKFQSAPSLALPRGEGKKIAFTLAEVLITIGIIGVVAAMTIPTLLTAHQKKVTVTKLQKAISILNQAYRLSYDENGEATAQEAVTMGAEAYFEKYWAPYLKTAHICKTYEDCGYSSLYPFKTFKDSRFGNGVVDPPTRTTFYTADGFVYVIMTANHGGEGGSLFPLSEIYVDINGSKGPNLYGHDLFLLMRSIDEAKGGSIIPACHGATSQEINNNCNKDTTNGGACCAEKILRAGWQIDKSYPW